MYNEIDIRVDKMDTHLQFQKCIETLLSNHRFLYTRSISVLDKMVYYAWKKSTLFLLIVDLHETE